jgi:hypothetical protein
MLQMGEAYTINRDGYVYVYSPNGSVEGTMNRLVIFRAPKDKFVRRQEYEYFVSRERDGGAAWSKNIGDRKPVHEFPAGWANRFEHPYAWHPSVLWPKRRRELQRKDAEPSALVSSDERLGGPDDD